MRTFPLLIYLVLLHTAMLLLVRAMCSHKGQLQFAFFFFFFFQKAHNCSHVGRCGLWQTCSSSREGCSRWCWQSGPISNALLDPEVGAAGTWPALLEWLCPPEVAGLHPEGQRFFFILRFWNNTLSSSVLRLSICAWKWWKKKTTTTKLQENTHRCGI